MIDIFLVVGYFIIVLFIGIYASRKESKEGFLIGERKMGTLSLSSSISASLLGGGILVAYAAYVYQYGMSAMWLFLGLAVGLVMLLLYGKKIKHFADRKQLYTISDYFKELYGKSTGLVTTLVIILVFIFMVVIEFIAGGKMLSSMFGTSYAFAVLIMAIIILVYLILGGFKSVVKTDAFQYLIALLFGIIITFVLFGKTTLPLKEFSLGTMGWGNSIAFVIIGAFAVFAAADMWQRIYAAKSVKVAKKSMGWAILLVLIFGFIIAIVGIAAKVNFSGLNPQDAMVYGLSNLLPTGILGLGLVLLFAAIMSSIDTGLFILGMGISKDITGSFKTITKEKLVRITRYSIFCFVVLTVLISLFFQNVVSIALVFASINLALIPALIGSFHFNLKGKAVFWSILIGLISVPIALPFLGVTPESAVISLPVALIVLLVGQAIFKKNKTLI
mgnify:FL=1